MKTFQGLPVEIYRNSNQSQPINKFNEYRALILVDSEINASVITDDSMAVKIVKNNYFGKEYIHAEPITPGRYAMGGTFIYTCDSRFRELYPYPIPLHDRRMDLEKR